MEELDKAAIDELLHKARLAHVGLSDGGRAYVIPMFYGYDGDAFYFHSHPGVKDEYIDNTKEACLVVMSIIGPDDWNSVQVFGQVAKITLNDERKQAEAALLDVPLPPEYGVMPSGKPKRSDQHFYYWKLTPTLISGRTSAHVTK